MLCLVLQVREGAAGAVIVIVPVALVVVVVVIIIPVTVVINESTPLAATHKAGWGLGHWHGVGTCCCCLFCKGVVTEVVGLQ